MYAHTTGFFFPIPGRGGALSIKMPVLMQHQTFCNGHESFVRGRGNFLFFLKIWKCLFFWFLCVCFCCVFLGIHVVFFSPGKVSTRIVDALLEGRMLLSLLWLQETGPPSTPTFGAPTPKPRQKEGSPQSQRRPLPRAKASGRRRRTRLRLRRMGGRMARRRTRTASKADTSPR